MANSPRITPSVANACLEGAFQTTPNSGTITIYTGTQPATASNPLSGNTALVTLTLNATAFGAASGGSISANSIPPGTASASGTATWFRVYTSGAATIMDGSCGTSSADMILSSVSIAALDVISISAFTIAMPLS